MCGREREVIAANIQKTGDKAGMLLCKLQVNLRAVRLYIVIYNFII